MALLQLRMAHCALVTESEDLGCGLFLPDGRQIAEGGITVDLTGSEPETETGCNSTFIGSTRVGVFVAVRTIFLDEAITEDIVPQNEGVFWMTISWSLKLKKSTAWLSTSSQRPLILRLLKN